MEFSQPEMNFKLWFHSYIPYTKISTGLLGVKMISQKARFYLVVDVFLPSTALKLLETVGENEIVHRNG